MDGLDDMEMIDANADFDEEIQDVVPDDEIQENYSDDEMQEDFPDEEIEEEFPDEEIQQDFPNPDIIDDAVVEVENVGNLMVDATPTFTFNLEGTGLDRRLRTRENGNK